MVPVAYIADKWGRRKTIQFGCVVYMYAVVPTLMVCKNLTFATTHRLGGALQTGARNMDFMLAGRFFAGMS